MVTSVRPDRCSNCGATLTPGLAWCAQCYTPVPVVEVPVPRRAPTPTDHLGKVEYTRWHATATTFGPATKILLTAGYVGVAAVVLFAYFRMTTLTRGMVVASFIVYAAAFGAMGYFFLRSLWKPGAR